MVWELGWRRTGSVFMYAGSSLDDISSRPGVPCLLVVVEADGTLGGHLRPRSTGGSVGQRGQEKLHRRIW